MKVPERPSRVPGILVEGDSITLFPQPMESPYKPADFQLEDIAAMAAISRHRGGSLNASDMGCYKTTTGLWLAETLLQQEGIPPKLLIVTTKTGKVPFLQHIPYLLPDWECVSIDNTSRLPEAPWHVPDWPLIALVHYNLLQQKYAIPKLLGKLKWGMILLDEAHRIKNYNASWTKSIKSQFRHVPYKHLMTANPYVNRPDEVWSLLNFLYPKEYTSYWRFRGHFCEVEQDTNHNTGVKYSIVQGFRLRTEDGLPAPAPLGTPDHAIREFRTMMEATGVRRHKRDLFKELPPVTETKVYVELSAAQKRMYKDMKNTLLMLDEQGVPITAPVVIAQMMRLRQVCVGTPHVVGSTWVPILKRMVDNIRIAEPSSKLDALMDILEGTDTQSVVFSNFADPLLLASWRLKRAGIDHIHLWQADPAAGRARKVADFQAGKAKVFLSTIPLGGEAITLTAADKVIFLDRAWSPTQNDQAVARVDRPGQTQPVQVIDIQAVNTLDQYVDRVLDRKRGWFDAIFN